MSFAPDIAAAISLAAAEFHVEPALLAAIVIKESGGDTWAIRYEPAWKYMWDVETNAPFRGTLNPETFPAPDYVSSPTEWNSQRTSWGLMQVMGAKARELGFVGKFLSELCDPVVGVRFGAKFVSKLQKKYESLEDVVSSYNAGHPRLGVGGNGETYVRPVMGLYEDFRRTGI